MIYLLLIWLYLLLYGYLAIKNCHWAIYILIFALPSYLIRWTIFGLPLTLLEAMILILFGASLFTGKINWSQVKNNQFFWPAIVIFLAATIGALISPNTLGALGVWKAYFLEPLLFFMVIISRFNTTRQLTGIFWSLGGLASYLSLIGIWQKFSGWQVPAAFLNVDGSVDRIVSLLGYPNALGLLLGPIIILFAGFLWQPAKNQWQIWAKWLVIILSFTAIILAKSEAAAISLIALGLIAGIMIKKTRLATIIIILLIIVVLTVSPALQEYLITKLLLQDYSGFIRRLIWQESWQMLKDHWFFGAGLAGYQIRIAPYHLPTFEIFLYPHNFVFNFWSELGLIGLAGFGWLTLKYLKENYKMIRQRAKNQWLNYTLIALTLQIIIHGLVDAPYFKNDLSLLFWLIISLVIIQQNINNQSGRGARVVE